MEFWTGPRVDDQALSGGEVLDRSWGEVRPCLWAHTRRAELVMPGSSSLQVRASGRRVRRRSIAVAIFLGFVPSMVLLVQGTIEMVIVSAAAGAGAAFIMLRYGVLAMVFTTDDDPNVTRV